MRWKTVKSIRSLVRCLSGPNWIWWLMFLQFCNSVYGNPANIGQDKGNESVNKLIAAFIRAIENFAHF